MFLVGWSSEIVHHILSHFVRFEPFLTRAEVCKVGVNHYCSLAATRSDLCYTPVVSGEQGIERTAAYFEPYVKRALKSRRGDWLLHVIAKASLALIGFLVVVFLSGLLFA